MANQPQGVDDRHWSLNQKRITDTTTALTAAGALGLGGMLAGKTKAAKKVLPKKVHEALRSGNADDVRNTIALASMVGGVASGIHWSKKLKSDAQNAEPVQNRLAKAAAVAEHMEIGKGIVASGYARTIRGVRPRRAYYRRASLPRPLRGGL